MKIYFLRPEIPAKEVLEEILNLINNEQELLQIAVAYFTHPIIIESLIQRTELGKETEIILNTSDIMRTDGNSSEVFINKDLIRLLEMTARKHNLRVKSLGVLRKNPYLYQNMHHKFVVSKSKVMFGSLNWTNAAMNGNYESIMVSENADLVSKFQEEFYELWNQAYDMYTSKGGKIRSIICPNCREPGGVDLESYGPFCTICGHSFSP